MADDTVEPQAGRITWWLLGGLSFVIMGGAGAWTNYVKDKLDLHTHDISVMQMVDATQSLKIDQAAQDAAETKADVKDLKKSTETNREVIFEMQHGIKDIQKTLDEFRQNGRAR